MEKKMKIYPNVKKKYDDKYPSDLINDVNGWAFSEEYLKKKLGKLLTLDIDFGINCSLNCPHCFRKDNQVDKLSEEMLSYKEIKEYIYKAKELGLHSVKFLGKGEPFEEENLIDFLKFLNRLDIIPLIFTKGHVIGDDDLAKKYFKKYNVTNSNDLVLLLKELNVSILLGLNSFYPNIQDKMVGNIEGYTLKRNRALELLAKAGFNRTNPTKLCIASNPITNENLNEMYEIYIWARQRNIYPIITTTMISGRAELNNYWERITPKEKKLIELYTSIYIYNIKSGIQTLEQIENEGIASYAGAHPCNQISSGMYITLNGTVLRCPGDDLTAFGNITSKSLSNIWHDSENYGRCGRFNCGCPPKWGKSIPYNLFTNVMINIKKHFEK